MSVTTVQLTTQVRDRLGEMRLHPRESYNDVMLRILEDLSDLDERTLKDINRARSDIRAGRGVPHAEVARRVGL